MRSNQIEALDAMIKVFAVAGFGAVGTMVLLMLAWPAWDAATQEFVGAQIVPLVGLGLLSLPFSGLLWIVRCLDSR